VIKKTAKVKYSKKISVAEWSRYSIFWDYLIKKYSDVTTNGAKWVLVFLIFYILVPKYETSFFGSICKTKFWKKFFVKWPQKWAFFKMNLLVAWKKWSYVSFLGTWLLSNCAVFSFPWYITWCPGVKNTIFLKFAFWVSRDTFFINKYEHFWIFFLHFLNYKEDL